MKDLFDLTGKIALVTGASRGIGESIARLLASRGAHVIVSSRKIDACQAVADSIVADGHKASAFACHVGNMDQIDAIFEHIKSEFGQIDILVNNAAANPYYSQYSWLFLYVDGGGQDDARAGRRSDFKYRFGQWLGRG